MSHKLKNKKIAFLATDGFEQLELTRPWDEFKNQGAEAELVSLETGEIFGMNHDEKGDNFTVDKSVDEVSASDYNGLVLPGGLLNPDTLRQNQRAVHFVREFF
jgi:protease I